MHLHSIHAWCSSDSVSLWLDWNFTSSLFDVTGCNILCTSVTSNLILYFALGSWPIAACNSLEPGTCKLIILETCRHNVQELLCLAPEDSLSSPQHHFPAQFVKVQYVIALCNEVSQELLDCRLEPLQNNAMFRIVNVSTIHVTKVMVIQSKLC